MYEKILQVKDIYTPIEYIKDGLIIWNEENKIIYCGPESSNPDVEKKDILDFHAFTAVPGFLDIHTHGGWGVTFGIGDLKEELFQYSEHVLKSGVTGFLITVSGPSQAVIINILESYVPLLKLEVPGAVPLGFHLEGPFLNPERHGAFNTEWLRTPTIRETQNYIDAAQGYLRQVSLAPELENAFAMAAYLKKQNIQVALAHSDANFETAEKALAGNFSHVTHAFNTQSPFHHREPGVIGAVLTSDRATAELIADGVHVHPGAMRLLLRCLGEERVVLVTDAMPGAGLADGEYELVGQKVFVRDGKASLTGGTIAGSVATMDVCVHNIIKLVGIPPNNAYRMASLNPARVIGMEDVIGSLDTGHYADITLLDRNGKVQAVFIKGELVFGSEK